MPGKNAARRPRNRPEREPENAREYWNAIYGAIPIIILVSWKVIFEPSILLLLSMETQSVNTPYQGPKVIQTKIEDDSALWGTYRPGAFLGLRTKEPSKVSVTAGLMWYTQQNLLQRGPKNSIRYMCDDAQEDVVFGYVEHDTVNYGHQIIKDGKKNGFSLQTTFLRPENDEYTESISNSGTNTDWTTRIMYETNNSELAVSLIWYAYIDPGEMGNNKPLLNDQMYSLDVLEYDGVKLGIPLAKIMGSTPSLSDFQMSIIPVEFNDENGSSEFQMDIQTSVSRSWCSSAAMLKQCLSNTMSHKQRVIKQIGIGSQIVLSDENSNKCDNCHKSNILNNFVAVQITISHSSKKLLKDISKFKNVKYTFDVAYTQRKTQVNDIVFKETSPSLIANKFDIVRTEYSHKFHQIFQESFPILKIKEENGEISLLLDFAKATFSNMAGSLGYFYGSSLVHDDDEDNYNNRKDELPIVSYWDAGLLTIVPSRSKFPRGFLWDEGFHGLMIGSWDINLQLQILGHWMDLLNNRGWIPREQILGSEAGLNVPFEFVNQHSQAANPPAFFLTVDLLLRQIKEQQERDDITKPSIKTKLKFDEIDSILRRLYPRLKSWYSWFQRTQLAVYPKSINSDKVHKHKKFLGYRWRGRDAITNKELNPKTLTSGMDDYPRSSHPVHDNGTVNVQIHKTSNKKPVNIIVSERHVDLYCWMAHGARIMSNLHNYLQPSGVKDFDNEYFMHYQMLVRKLDSLHWTEESIKTSHYKMPMYADYGVHSDGVYLKTLMEGQDSVRIVRKGHEPRWRFVDSYIGYNTLFPMFFRLIRSSQRLNAILDLIEGTHEGNILHNGLLTKGCGIRSLTSCSPLYNKRNTMHDPPYWRGSVWINMQYLACSSLNYYASLPITRPPNTKDRYYNILEPLQFLDLKTKTRCREMYDRIRNDVIQCVFREWKRTGFIWEQYEDKPTKNTFGSSYKGKGARPFTGWSANVLLLMAEIY